MGSQQSAEDAKDNKPILMIPGPIEFDEAVLKVIGEPSPSHVAKSFIAEFGNTLKNVREVFLAQKAQPFVLAGSGTLGWDAIVANLLKEGDQALVINTGYFSDSFSDCCIAYGAAPPVNLQAQTGGVVDLKEVEKSLDENKFQLACLTMVDTSTGIRNDIESLAKLIRKKQPNCLIAVDGVCAFGGEEFRFDDWDIDCAMTASQKALGVPPGLCVMAFSERAMAVREARKSVRAYFCDLLRWLPIMKAYEAGKPSYFATPPVNLIRGLNISLGQILAEGMEKRFATHKKTSLAFKAALAKMELKLVPTTPDIAAHTLSAIYFPKGVTKEDLLPKITAKKVILAGGLHKDIKAKYFRVGHMGVSVCEPNRNDVARVVNAIEASLIECGIKLTPGEAIKAFQEAMK